jgi:hypothetical protein
MCALPRICNFIVCFVLLSVLLSHRCSGSVLRSGEDTKPTAVHQPAANSSTGSVFGATPEIAPAWGGFARGVSEITAAAVSPLLVVSAIGAWRYCRSPDGEREDLPFFCHPFIWGAGLALLLLCGLKDLFGPLIPSVLKKPFDMLEVFENKLSALVAGTIFVPVVAWQMMQHFPASVFLPSDHAGVSFASVLPLSLDSYGFQALVLPMALVCFVTVWVTAHVVNVLIALCPIGLLDSALKLLKNFVVAAILMLSIIHPTLGAVLCTMIVLFAAYVFGFAMRFAIFGAVFAADVLLLWRSVGQQLEGDAHGFIFGVKGVPPRTFGSLQRREGGRYVFAYKPWLILPTRHIFLPEKEIVIVKGLLSVSAAFQSAGGGMERVLEFLPRHRVQVESLAERYGVRVQDGPAYKGLRAVWFWLRDTVWCGRSGVRSTVCR